MLCKRQTKSTQVYQVVVLLIALHLTQTEASPLKKSLRWKGKKATVLKSGFKPGVIVFGEEPKNTSVKHDHSYQADYPFPGQVTDVSNQFSMMDPELLCGNDQMRFTASGRPAMDFAMTPYPNMPLKHAPSSCGYTMEGGNPLRLVFNAAYDGCDIYIKDGCFNLPLLWRGIPVTLKCPQTEDPTIIPQEPSPIYSWLPWLQPQEATTTAPPAPFLPPVPAPIYPWLPWLQPQEATTTAPPPPFLPPVPAPIYSWLPWLQPQETTTTAPPPPFLPPFPPGFHPYPLWPQDPVVPQYPAPFWPPYLKHPQVQSPIPFPQNPFPKKWYWSSLFPTTTPPSQNLDHQQIQNYLQHLKSPSAHQHRWGYKGAKDPPVIPDKSVQLPLDEKWWTTDSTTPTTESPETESW